MSLTDNFYINQKEPNKSCFLALRDIISGFNEHINQTVKYQLPCFCYKNKAMCYLWKDKKTNEPYVLVVEGKLIDHPLLEQGDRKRMKVFRVNPEKDIDIDSVHEILTLAVDLYTSGKIKTK